jgi:hypothetical protein
MRIQQVNWLNRGRKAAGAKGPAQADLLEDLGQNVQVADLDRFDFDFLGGVKDMVMPFSAGAVAAQFTQISIFNPAGSGVLGFLDFMELFANTVTMLCTEGIISADPGAGLGAQFTPYHFDQRFGATVPAVGDISSFICRQGTLAAPVTGNIVGRVLTVFNVLSAYPRRIVLAPGTGYTIIGNVVNQAFTGNIWWRERVAESGELGLGS